MEYSFMRSKLIKNILLILVIGVIFCGCDVYAGKRPNAYRNSKWVSEDPQIELVVDSKGYIACFIGEGEGQQEYDVLFTYGREIIFIEQNSSSSKDFLFRGECFFGEEKMTVRVYAAEDQLFYGQYETLVFVRQE